ncbi:hypothetical protein GCM10010172_29250 [Paractinoplanes ferrugineus]|uniref:Uncharacterized protein n=1 Tax=Paractinoplanes ferrugineus TaxID=113564 RepID=A0A919ITD2_9ACTN|nr:hypothetical protein Afe05nite_00050 [Actinoplanes ferrugineus]
MEKVEGGWREERSVARRAAYGATMLMILGVHERLAMDVMGWATTGMAACYQHVTDPVRDDVAGRRTYMAREYLTAERRSGKFTICRVCWVLAKVPA